MANPDLKHLSKIIDLCRKKGVESIEIDGVKVTLGHPVEKQSRRSRAQSPEEPVIEDQFSEEATLFWSSGGIPMDGAN